MDIPVSAVIAIVTSIVTAAVTVGVTYGRFTAMEARVRELEQARKDNGKRLGEVETDIKIAKALRERRLTRPQAVPQPVDPEESDDG